MIIETINDRINEIISRRLSTIDYETIRLFPKVLREPRLKWETINNDKILAVFFLSNKDLHIIKDNQARYHIPFPGLYTTDIELPAASRLNKSRFIMIQNITVKNNRVFSIGQDSSLVIKDVTIDLQVDIKQAKTEQIMYHIPLAYIISYGEEITQDNVFNNLEELIAYSIKTWRQPASI